MNVFELSLRVFLIENIHLEDVFTEVSRFVDLGLSNDKDFLELHNKNTFKNYCFNSFYPLEIDKVYKKNNVYTIKIRTIDSELATFFHQHLPSIQTLSIKGLVGEVRIIPKKYIEKIYSVTPVVIKCDNGYWRKIINIQEYEKRIKENLIKKYNTFNNTIINEEFNLYDSIEFTNRKPISTKYKEIKILGDKVSLNISSDKEAQELAYMSLGVGLLEMNARGMGYVNYKWL